MKPADYIAYADHHTLMGPNSLKVLAELISRCPSEFKTGDHILDLGCGTGLSSFALAEETGAHVTAVDLWTRAEDNAERFAAWGVSDRVTPVRADATELRFPNKQFQALFSVDAYHYFGGSPGFFQDRILPFLDDGCIVLIAVPGLRDGYDGRAEELLSDWLGEESCLFRSSEEWKSLIGAHARIESVGTWEMACFQDAWNDWLRSGNEHSMNDAKYFDSHIRPYTCFVGICVHIRRS